MPENDGVRVVKTAVKKVLRDPIGAFTRTIDKFIVGPRRYRNERGYDANAYWGRRFARHGDSLRGPGDEGLSEADNGRDYAAAAEAFDAFCQKHDLDFAAAKTLEVGPGTGFYTGRMVGLGARALTLSRRHRRLVRRAARQVPVGRVPPGRRHRRQDRRSIRPRRHDRRHRAHRDRGSPARRAPQYRRHAPGRRVVLVGAG